VAKLGGTVSGDVLTNFETGFTNDFGLVAVTAHLLFAAVTVHIPIGQIIDHYAGATNLSLKQIVIRALTMALVRTLHAYGTVADVSVACAFCVQSMQAHSPLHRNTTPPLHRCTDAPMHRCTDVPMY
jgi:hypothetical protein